MWSCITYDTAKYVNIKDARLAILRFCLLLGIALYVGVFEMWAQGGWLDSVPVVGVVRFSLQQPTVHNCDPNLPDCQNAFAPLNELPYCQQASLSDTYQGNTYPCEIYEATNAQIVSEKSIAIITKASKREQELVCQETEMVCPRTYNDTESQSHEFYTAQSEAFTVLVDHAVTAAKICAQHHNYACSSEAVQYQGRLLSRNDALCKTEYARGNAFDDYRGTASTTTKAPCYIAPNRTSRGQDFFSLDVLLQASNHISLDDCNNVTTTRNESSKEERCQTYRETGGTILLNIYWSDFQQYHGMVEPYYYYSAHVLPGLAFKQSIPFYHKTGYRTSRTLLKVHGFSIAVLFGGEYHAFHVVTFLVTLTTAVGLLAVATALVDALMLYVLPEKERYLHAKYEQEQRIEGGEQEGNAEQQHLNQPDELEGFTVDQYGEQEETRDERGTLDDGVAANEESVSSLNEPLL